MPEGHTIHRLARRQRADLVGERVAASSPQGRFAAGAARIDGSSCSATEAVGKHLLHVYDADLVLHVHLGLVGRFRRFRGPDRPDPSDGTRLVLATDDVEWRLSGPMTCELIDPAQAEAIRASLGPDPLAGDDPTDFAARLRSTDRPVAAALLDQSIVAGIGNVYRAEVLFLAGIDPRRPASAVGDDDVRALWDLAVEQMAAGERLGRIVTVDPADVGVERVSDMDRDERLYVYKRAGELCHRCRTAISLVEVAGRKAWWCPTCQPF